MKDKTEVDLFNNQKTDKLVELEEQTIFDLNESSEIFNDLTINTEALDFENATIQIENDLDEENSSIEIEEFTNFEPLDDDSTKELNIAFEEMKVIENEKLEEIAIKIEEETGIMKEGEFGKVNIMVIGVGGCGCNAVNRMYEDKIEAIKLVAMDTSEQTLENISADFKLLIGESSLQGHGSGGDVNKSQEAFLNSRDQIKKILTGVDMVFIAGGIGRGTGSVGLVEVGKVAREMGILTIGFATLPRRIEANVEIISKYYPAFVDSVDSNVIVENEKVGQIARELPIFEAMKVADSMLVDGIKGIFELITKPGKINLDYADIKTAFSNQGSCIMGIGYGTGDNAVSDAIKKAIHSEIVNQDSIKNAKTIIFNITCPERTVTVSQATAGSEFIYSFDEDDNIEHLLFGYSYDESLNDQVKVTFIATGTIIEPVYNPQRPTQSLADKFGRKQFGNQGQVQSEAKKPLFSPGKPKKASDTIDIFSKVKREEEKVEPKVEPVKDPVIEPKAEPVEKESTIKMPDFFKRR